MKWHAIEHGGKLVAGALALTAVHLPPSLNAQAVTVTSSARDQTLVSLTVYNQNFGLIREVRDVSLARGRIRLEFGDVPSQIQPETVYLSSSRGSGLTVLEQNYQYDLLNPQKLLEKYVGRDVTIYRYNSRTGRDESVPARVLSTNGGPVLNIGGEITFNYPGRFSFPEIPRNLISKPTLSLLLENEQEQDRIEVSYLTRGIGWKADYVVLLNDSAYANLQGWVTLDNQSGTSFSNAELQLVAGDVNRVAAIAGKMRQDVDALRSMVREARQFDEQGLLEYHLYTMQRPTTVLNNESKQVTLLRADRLRYDKKLIFYGASQYFRGSYGQVISNQKVGVFLDFANSEDNGLGVPLPGGVMRVYKADESGRRQFVGEDRIDHTPRDENVRLKLGDSFDVTGDRRQTDYRVVSSCISESAWRIAVRNHKDSGTSVQIVEPAGYEWEILASSEAYNRLDAQTFSYDVTVPARGEHVINYRIRVKWC